jgi:hypothetical protein
MKIKRLSLYSTLHFDLKSALGGAPLDAARKKIIGDNPPFFFTGLIFGICSKHWSKGPVPMGPEMAQVFLLLRPFFAADLNFRSTEIVDHPGRPFVLCHDPTNFSVSPF